MIAFEYQGEQHYGHSTFMRENINSQTIRDKEKQIGCKTTGITLVHIPYWWDGSKEQLIATIAEIRPDLIPQPVMHKPIPKTIAIVPPGKKRFY
jgi:hypothetical protein